MEAGIRVVINGAGVAGPTLAWWLAKFGHDVVLVEQAPALRGGGYVVDFWGAGYDVAEKMGLTPRLHELGYRIEEVRFVGRDGRKRGGFSADVFARMTGGRFTSLRRSDLARALFEALGGRVETVFGDSVAGIEAQAGGVRVSFERSAPREADIVVGADGLHSRVRELAFGAGHEHALGYHVAAFEAAGYPRRDELVYVSHAEPGRQVSRFSMRDDRTLFLFVFKDSLLDGEPQDDAARKGALRQVFEGTGWECPQILELVEATQDLYFDRVSQIRLDGWSRARTVLVGDAAACVSLLAGEGTGLAMAEAYVLAGELHRCDGDPASAFARYETRMLPFLRRKQASAAAFASSFVPGTTLGIVFRNLVTRLLRVPAVADFFIGRDLRDDVELPDYRA